MSDEYSVATTFDDDEEKGERRARGSRSGKMARRLTALFCCLKCEPHVEETVEYNPDEFDYIVEKLTVKRVPLALIAIPSDLADNNWRPTSSSAVGGVQRAVNVTREASTRIRPGDERRSLGYEAKSSAWRKGIPSRFNALPDLKEFKCSLKDPLNVSRSRGLSAEDISEATSSMRTDASSMTLQDDVSTRDDFIHSGFSISEFESKGKLHAKKDEAARDASSGKERDKFVPGWNRKYIVSPFRARRGSFDLAKPKGVIEDLSVDGKSLAYIDEFLEDKSSKAKEDMKDRNVGSNTAVRWRITIRHQRTNANIEHASECPSLEKKTHR